MRLKRNLIVLSLLIAVVVCTGCGRNVQPSFFYFVPMDSDGTGIIGENDVHKSMYDTGTVAGFRVSPNGKAFFGLKNGRTAQLIGIKVPEPASGYLNMCWGYFHKLALNKHARMEYDELKSEANIPLVYLYVGDIFVNAKMVETGYAYASPMPPNSRYDEQIASLEANAKSEKRGIWAFMAEEE